MAVYTKNPDLKGDGRMKKIHGLLIGLCIILSGCSQDGIVPPDSAMHPTLRFTEWEIAPYFVPKDISVVALGDSLTEGVGDELNKGGYVGRLTTHMSGWKGVRNVQLENLAKRGRRSDQLLKQLKEDEYSKTALMGADIIVLTVGGNDMMKIVKRDLFNLTKEPFYEELVNFEERMLNTVNEIRLSNARAPIILPGLYNPFSLVTDEVNGFQEIIGDWNSVLEGVAELDGNACYVPVTDLFESNQNMVYHKDFFHPNGYGYQLMADRIIESLGECSLYELTNGEMDF